MNKYTAFCQEAGGGGTTWIDTVEADNIDEACDIARANCAADWSVEEVFVHVLGLAEGNVNILHWNDQVD